MTYHQQQEMAEVNKLISRNNCQSRISYPEKFTPYNIGVKEQQIFSGKQRLFGTFQPLLNY